MYRRPLRRPCARPYVRKRPRFHGAAVVIAGCGDSDSDKPATGETTRGRRARRGAGRRHHRGRRDEHRRGTGRQRPADVLRGRHPDGVLPSVVQIKRRRASARASCSTQGHIVTNAHVVGGATVQVTLATGRHRSGDPGRRHLPARRPGGDPTPTRHRAAAGHVRRLAQARGSARSCWPWATRWACRQRHRGIISRRRAYRERAAGRRDAPRRDPDAAAINPGNSGGALVDLPARWSASRRSPPPTRSSAARRAGHRVRDPEQHRHRHRRADRQERTRRRTPTARTSASASPAARPVSRAHVVASVEEGGPADRRRHQSRRPDPRDRRQGDAERERRCRGAGRRHPASGCPSASVTRTAVPRT